MFECNIMLCVLTFLSLWRIAAPGVVATAVFGVHADWRTALAFGKGLFQTPVLGEGDVPEQGPAL